MPSLNWHDLDSFEPGEFYRQVESGKTVQFVGVNAGAGEVHGQIECHLAGPPCQHHEGALRERTDVHTNRRSRGTGQASTAQWRAFVKGRAMRSEVRHDPHRCC